jgi:hypothetical protein
MDCKVYRQISKALLNAIPFLAQALSKRSVPPFPSLLSGAFWPWPGVRLTPVWYSMLSGAGAAGQLWHLFKIDDHDVAKVLFRVAAPHVYCGGFTTTYVTEPP